MTDTPQTFEYREDGWPLCPECGEDELWDPRSFDRPADPSARLSCYQCGFEGKGAAER